MNLKRKPALIAIGVILTLLIVVISLCFRMAPVCIGMIRFIFLMLNGSVGFGWFLVAAE